MQLPPLIISPRARDCRNCHFEAEPRNLVFVLGLKIQDPSLRSG
jgi:hypothetical protein